jgi:protein transport protein SEC23
MSFTNIRYGDTIAKWRADGIHLKPEYDYFAELLKAPKADAENTMKGRFPFPRFIECIEGGSQSRFLMAKLNPSITQNTVRSATQCDAMLCCTFYVVQRYVTPCCFAPHS